MPFSWQLFRIICFLQMLAATYFSFTSLISFFNYGGFPDILETIAFALIASFAIFAMNLLNTNYPDKPVAGKQKSAFNWLFLLNFLLLAFLFALFFSTYRMMNVISQFSGHSIFSLSFRFWWLILIFTLMIIFQFSILYGLYILRRLLYLNFFQNKQFEFEGQERNHWF